MIDSLWVTSLPGGTARPRRRSDRGPRPTTGGLGILAHPREAVIPVARAGRAAVA